MKELLKYLYNELPIRLSQRIIDLNKLPYGLAHNHSINKIREWYITSFSDLVNLREPATNEDCKKFGQTIHNIFDRHKETYAFDSTIALEIL